MKLKYNRVLLKLSGESLGGDSKQGIDFNVMLGISKQIKDCVENGVQIGIVVGGGNFWRGRQSIEMDRVRADHIGMLATVMNCLALADCLDQCGVSAKVQTAIALDDVAEPYSTDVAKGYLKEGKVVIFGFGTGNPFFSTDTAAALRAAQIHADIILKATMVDGVYESDPKVNKDAKKYDEISFAQVFNKNLGVIDGAAASLCKENNIPLFVFSILSQGNIFKAAMGTLPGTLVHN